MEEEPQVNAVRHGPDGSLEFYDGAEWVPYPDVPEEVWQPGAVSRTGQVSRGDGDTA
ncbi:hypothetical protein [Streptomyces sp. NPDC057877]|uniref:hypothetical protein n=1 Tax=Streptomyces sp. NPDC057877 TaxID=3346269 RepID=UPI00369886FD